MTKDLKVKEGYDHQREYRCVSKYDKIVNKFEELINMVDRVTKVPKLPSTNSKGKRVFGNKGRNVKASKGGTRSPSIGRGDDNRIGGGALVELITNHLLDLNNLQNED